LPFKSAAAQPVSPRTRKVAMAIHVISVPLTSTCVVFGCMRSVYSGLAARKLAMQLRCPLRLRKSPGANAIGHVAAQEHERKEPLHLIDRGWHLALRMHEQPHGLRRWFAQHEIRSQPERAVDHQRAVYNPFAMVLR